MVYTEMYDIISQKGKFPASPRSPIVNTQFGNSLRSLYKGDKTKITGYVELSTVQNITLKRKLERLFNELNLYVKNGFETFNFYAETTKIPTKKVLIAPYGANIKSDILHEFKVVYLNRIAYVDYFYIEDYERTAFKMESQDFKLPVLSLNGMVKGLGEIAPSLSKKPGHLAHSVLSNYIGSDFIDKHIEIDGVNSSYLKDGDTKSNLLKIKSVFENRNASIPLSHFGIINYLDGNVGDIEKMRSKANLLKRWNVLSWNRPSDSTTIKMSVFNYSSDGALNIYGITDLKNNLLWQHSILSYAIKDKTVSSQQFGEVMYSVSKVINSYLDKGEDGLLSQVMDLNNIDLWVGRVTSYFLAFSSNKDVIVPNAVRTLTYNISDAVLSLHSSKQKSKLAYKEKTEVDPRVRVALYLTKTRLKEEFIERIIQITGWSYKITEKYVDGLINGGYLYAPDNIHYRWYTESKFRFKK